MRVLLVGGPAPYPFAGAFAVSRRCGATQLLVAARTGVDEPIAGWDAAEAGRRALLALGPGDRFAVLTACFDALRGFGWPAPAVLALARDADGIALSACGLAELRVDGRPLVEPDHPLLSPDGLPARVGFYREDTPGVDYVGLPVGAVWPAGDLDRACGARRWA